MLSAVSQINLQLDEALMARVDLALWSPLEGKVPKGSYQRFFNDLLRRAFEQIDLDLGPYTGSLPGEQVVRGTTSSIEALRQTLESRL